MNCPSCHFDNPAGFKFCGSCGQTLITDSSAPAQPKTAETKPAFPRDERRDITILFADVKGFTAMCEHLDPEMVHTIMNECFEGLGKAIKDQGGYVDKYIGDNVMALFGAPVAHEDDPVRACRAALDMQNFLYSFSKKLQTQISIPLQMRIGINCGLVVTGGMGSNEVKRDYTAMGDSVNLASRLESSAKAEHILVSSEVMKRTRRQFKFGPAQHITVKGKEKPVEAYDLLEEFSEIDPRGRDGLSATLVGREKELQTLVNEIQRPPLSPCLIEIVGEMGIGKTRLVEETQSIIPEKKFLMVHATPSLSNRPYGLIQRMLNKILFEINPAMEQTNNLENFARTLSSLGHELDFFAQALWFLLAPQPLKPPPPDSDPQTVRRMVEQGITLIIEKFYEQNKDAILVIESFELADKDSQELIKKISGGDGRPFLMIITSRKGQDTGYSNRKTIKLLPLSKEEQNTLLDRLIRNAVLPLPLKENILKRSAGIPLHLEEIIRSLTDRNILVPSGEKKTWEFDGEKYQNESLLPNSIRASMTSRLDQLAISPREFLNECSIQGLDFDTNVVETLRKEIKKQPESALQLIPELESKSFIEQNEEPDPAKMRFCHPLMQETCYQTMLQKERILLHEQTAQTLIMLSGSENGVIPDLLAYHYENAQKWDKAAKAHFDCGAKAESLYLNEEAVSRYQKVIESVQKLADLDTAQKMLLKRSYIHLLKINLCTGQYTRIQEFIKSSSEFFDTPQEYLEVQRISGLSLYHLGKITEAKNIFEGILRYTVPPGPGLKIEVLLDLATLYYRENKTDTAVKLIEECRRSASDGQKLLKIKMDMLEGICLHTAGKFQDAFILYQRSLAMAEETGTFSERARALNNMGNAQRDLGNYVSARQYYEQALYLWKKIGDAEGVAGAHNNLGNIGMSRGEYEFAREHQEAALREGRKISNLHIMALAQTNLAVLANEEENPGESIQYARQALDTLGETGTLLKALIKVILSEGLLKTENFEAAKSYLDEILKETNETQHPLAFAYAIRAAGKLRLQTNHIQEASSCYKQARELFLKLNRTQEYARTLLEEAKLLYTEKKLGEALSLSQDALTQFKNIHALKDIQRAEKFISECKAARVGN